MKPFRSSIIFFILLELIHIPGIPILNSMKIYGPSDLKDILVLPLFLTFNFYLLSYVKWKINKGFIFGLFHIIFGSAILFIDRITGKNTNCIDCEPAEFFLEGVTGCICSFFTLINHLAIKSIPDTPYRDILVTFGINIFLMGLYLFSLINIALFIEKKK